MATVGQVLKAPESGWKRYDDTDSNIQYIGTTWVSLKETVYYNGTTKQASSTNDYVEFMFYGRDIRIIGMSTTNSNVDNNLKIIIDDIVYTFSNSYSTGLQTLLFEKTGLEETMHTVKISTGTTNKYIWFDAVDINENGYLYKYIYKNLLKSNNKIYSLQSNKLTELSILSIDNFMNYGAVNITNFNNIQSNKNYILSKNESENTDGLRAQDINRKPLSIKFE